jgi:hypothetical protein
MPGVHQRHWWVSTNSIIKSRTGIIYGAVRIRHGSAHNRGLYMYAMISTYKTITAAAATELLSGYFIA